MNARTQPVKVSDLPELIGTPYPRPMLWCERCNERFSAERGDYWAADPATILTCGTPGCRRRRLLLVPVGAS